jgi:hypothetical protein
MKDPEEIDKFCQFLDQLTIRSRTDMNATTAIYRDQLFELYSKAGKKKRNNVIQVNKI